MNMEWGLGEYHETPGTENCWEVDVKVKKKTSVSGTDIF